jgi:hypothetical protein
MSRNDVSNCPPLDPRLPEVSDRVTIKAVDYSVFDPRYVGRSGVVTEVRDIDQTWSSVRYQYRMVTIRLARIYLGRKVVTMRAENVGIIAAK